MSIWHYLILWLVALLDTAFSPVLAINTLAASLPAPVWSSIIEWCGFFSCFVDLNALFSVLSILLLWRLAWLVVRLWRIFLEVIPLLG